MLSNWECSSVAAGSALVGPGGIDTPDLALFWPFGGYADRNHGRFYHLKRAPTMNGLSFKLWSPRNPPIGK